MSLVRPISVCLVVSLSILTPSNLLDSGSQQSVERAIGMSTATGYMVQHFCPHSGRRSDMRYVGTAMPLPIVRVYPVAYTSSMDGLGIFIGSQKSTTYRYILCDLAVARYSFAGEVYSHPHTRVSTSRPSRCHRQHTSIGMSIIYTDLVYATFDRPLC